MPFRELVTRRREGERPGLPVRDFDMTVLVVLIAAGLALAGAGLVAALVMLWRKHD